MVGCEMRGRRAGPESDGVSAQRCEKNPQAPKRIKAYLSNGVQALHPQRPLLWSVLPCKTNPVRSSLVTPGPYIVRQWIRPVQHCHTHVQSPW